MKPVNHQSRRIAGGWPHIITFLIFILSGCQTPTQSEAELWLQEGWLRAVIHGEAVEFEGEEVIGTIDGKIPNYLHLSARDIATPGGYSSGHFFKTLGFSAEYRNGKTEYNVMPHVIDTLDAAPVTGGGYFYGSYVDDVLGTAYEPVEDEINRLSIKTDTLEAGRIMVSGYFAMKMVKKDTKQSEYPDTLLVTGGEFKAPLLVWEDYLEYLKTNNKEQNK